MFRGILAFVLLFLTVFDLKIVGSIGSANITSVICFLMILINPKSIRLNFTNLFKCFKWFFGIYFFILFYIFLRILLDGAEDIGYFLTILKTTSTLISIVLYLIVFYDNKTINRMFNVFVLNALICLFFGTYPQLKPLIRPFQYGIENNILIGSNEYRNAFLSGSAYFGISSLYSLFFVMVIYIIIRDKKYIDYLKTFFYMIAGVMAGRIALISFFITGLFYVIFKRKFSIIFVFSIFSIFSLILLNSFSVFEQANLWLSDLFLRDDITENNSVNDYLTTMLFIPDGLTLYFGDAKYSDYYGGSDVGYIRHILFGGLVYVFLVLIALFSAVKEVSKKTIPLMMIFISLFLHMKGVFIFNNPGFFPVYIASVFYFYNEGNKKI